MNWPIIIEVLVVIGVVLAFAGSVWYLMTHNPNYEPREILRNPWKIFDLIDHAKENVTEGLKKIKEETQQAIEITKEIKDNILEAKSQIEQAINEIKQPTPPPPTIEEKVEVAAEVNVVEDKETSKE
jgi:hypothetical protein